MPRIVGRDSDIVRRMFLEATQAMGSTAIYHELRDVTFDLYNDPDTLYLPPITLDVIFDESPKVKMLKDLGWYNEDEDIRPLLIYLPIYKNMDKEILNVQENALIEIVYMGINKRAIFRVTAKRLDSLYGNYWVCKCVPERKIQFTYDSSDGFDFLNVGRAVISVDGATTADSAGSTIYSQDTGNLDSQVSEFGKMLVDGAVADTNINLEGVAKHIDIVTIDDLESLGMASGDSTEVSDFFSDLGADHQVNDSAKVSTLNTDMSSESISTDEGISLDSFDIMADSLVNDAIETVEGIDTGSTTTQSDSLGADDYSSLVMGE